MAIEHKSPTRSTAQYLYAHAFRCGFEGCPRPLYRIDEETGERTLNSRICHIKARREGGPRFDPCQTEDDNRSENNLILMCVEHASAIDDRKNLFAYTVEKLETWKQAQIQEFDNIRQNWILSEAMAAEVLCASEPNFSFSVADSILNLGGKGGSALGAGGGGGAAIGPNARGGDGGDGGNTVEAQIDLEHLRAKGFDHAEISVGSPGVASTLFGQKGDDGGDTVINFVTADGVILESISTGTAKGGFPGESKLPPNFVELSGDEIRLGFRITTLLPANAIDIRENLAFVLGGGWARYDMVSIPIDAYWTFLVSACWPEAALSGKKGLFLSILRPDGHETSRVAILCDASDSQHRQFIWASSIGVKLDIEGYWTVRVHASEQVLSEIKVLVNMLGGSMGLASELPD